eukprot:UN13348
MGARSVLLLVLVALLLINQLFTTVNVRNDVRFDDYETNENPIPYDGRDAKDVWIKYPIGGINYSSFCEPRFGKYGNISDTIQKEPESTYVVPQAIHTAWMGVPLPVFFRKTSNLGWRSIRITQLHT